MTLLKLSKKSRGGLAAASHLHAPKQEKAIANRIGGAGIKGSGSGDVRGDVRKKKVVRVEAKCTIHKSFSLTLEMIDKIDNAALSAGELPVIIVQFLEGNQVTHEVAVCPSYVLDLLAMTGTTR